MKALLFALGSGVVFAAAALAAGGGFRFISAAWHEGGSVPPENLFNGSGCAGANVSPEFHWSGAPSGTRSFAITIFDPDAPTGAGWWHWVLFNIPGTVFELSAGAGGKGSIPPGSVQCRNDYGEWGYGGPCPPVGTTHRYFARVYAVNVEKLSSGPETPPEKVAKQIEEHSIGVARLTVKFGR
jgi:Raf kinase inhibitor-like YbhB/YbcL family protein